MSSLPENKPQMKRLGSTLTAERAAVIRNFEVILFDNNRYNYFLDFLSQHNQAHKLLFWFDVEQFKLTAGNPHEMIARQEGIFYKYIDPASTSFSRLDNIPIAAVEVTERLVARGKACGFVFALAQALVAQELREYWFEKFTTSAAHIALVDHLRMTYPITLQELLAEGTAANGCLRRFVTAEGANGQPLCPTIVSANYKVWAYLNGTMRPLCGSVLRALDQLNVSVDGMSNILAGLLDECARLPATLTGEAEVSQETRTAIAGRLGALKGVNAGMLRSGDMDMLNRCVTGLGDALLEAQQQTYHFLESRLLPVLKRSSTYARFVEDMLALECLPLQARQLQLNDIADVLRKEPDRLQESKRISSLPHQQPVRGGDGGGSRWIHLFKPPPCSRPVLSSEGRGVQEGRDAERGGCPCWIMRQSARAKDLGEEIDVIESRKLPLLCQKGASKGVGGPKFRAAESLRQAGLLDPLLEMGDCKAMMVFMFQVGVREVLELVAAEDGTSCGGEGISKGSMTGCGRSGIHGCLAEDEPCLRADRSPTLQKQEQECSPSKIKRRFRTYIDQLKHIVIPRASRRAGASEDGIAGDEDRDSTDVGVGHDPRDSSYQEERISLNRMLLRLLEANLLECIPGYCLPGPLAKVMPSTATSPAGAADASRSALIPQPTVHHFVIPIEHRNRTGRNILEESGAAGAKEVTRSGDILLYAACLTVWQEAKDVGDQSSNRIPSNKEARMVFIPHCVCALSPHPFLDTLRAVVLEMGGMGGTQSKDNVDTVTKFFRGKNENAESDGGGVVGGGATSHGAPFGVSTLTLRAPPAIHAPADWSFWGVGAIPSVDVPLLPLFQVLSAESVMKALSALALERAVVVTGSVSTLIVACCEALLNLLHPLKWHYTYVPLIPASEVSGFWRRNALGGFVGNSSWTAASGGVSGPTPSAERGRVTSGQRMVSPFFVGLDADLVRLAQTAGTVGTGSTKDGAGNENGLEAHGPTGATTVWGVRSQDSCVESLARDRQAGGFASTQIPRSTLECVRRIIRCAVHIDLDNDEVNLPLVALDAASPFGQPLPDWPSVPLAHAQRAVMMAVFPEFESFDSLSSASTLQHTPLVKNGDMSSALCWQGQHQEAEASMLRIEQWGRQRQCHEFALVSSTNPQGDEQTAENGEQEIMPVHSGKSETPQNSTHSKLSNHKVVAVDCSDYSYVEAATLARRLRRLRKRHMPKGDRKTPSSSAAATISVGEAVVPMYRPTPTDRRLRNAFLVFMQEVLGRAAEFIQVFPEQGLAQLNTRAFMEANKETTAGPLGDVVNTRSTSFWESLVMTKCFYSLLCDLVSSDYDFDLTSKLLGNGVGLPGGDK